MRAKAVDTIDSLDELLDQERRALLNGNLDVIGRMFKRKETLIDMLNISEVTDRETLSHLNEKLVRNQALLGSALEGIQSIVERLAEMRRIKESLDTYDSSGNRTRINIVAKGLVEKRS